MQTKYKNCIICKGDHAKLLYLPLRIVKCSNCGLIYRDAVALEDDYYLNLNKYEQNLKDSVKLEARKREAEFRLDLITHIIKTKGKFLDIGANEGLLLLSAKKRGFSVFGCEPNIYAFNYALQYGLKLINKKFEDAFIELKKEAPFKVISLFHVLEHFSEPLKILKMVRELIDYQGYLVVEVPDISSPYAKIFSWEDLRINKEHLFYFKKRTLIRLLEKAGFKAIFMKRKVWDGFNRPLIENLIRLPLFSEIYLLLRKVKKIIKKMLGLEIPRKNLEDNLELWINAESTKEKKYILSGLLGKIIFFLNRGDDLFVIAKLDETKG